MLRWLAPTKPKNRWTPNRRLNSFRPSFESLENRLYLSASGLITTAIQPISSASTVQVSSAQTTTCTSQPPQACDNTATTTRNTCVTVDVCANDTCTNGTIDPKSVCIVCKPCHGTVKVDGKTGVVTYTPSKNYTGTDSFCYTVRDKTGKCSNVATCCLTVTPPNCPPKASNDSATTCKNTPVTINVLCNDTDKDGSIDPRTVVICKAPKHGTTCVDPCTGAVTYTPDSNYCGSDTFTYKVKDCNGAYSNVASVCVTVTAPKQAPEVCNDSVSGKVNKSIVCKVAANDPNPGGSIDWNTLCVVDQPCHGTVKVDSTGKITYTPDCNYCGVDTFTYQVKDKNGLCSNVATVCLTVKG